MKDTFYELHDVTDIHKKAEIEIEKYSQAKINEYNDDDFSKQQTFFLT